LVVLFDADSLIYASCFDSNKESGEKYLPLNKAYDKFQEGLDKIFTELSDQVEVEKFIVCNGSKGNFRYDISKDYKANRTGERPPTLGKLHDLVKRKYKSHYGIDVETDDVVATLWKRVVKERGIDSVIIVSIDKDYKQFPCWFYDYHWKRKTLTKITEEEATINFYTQMIVGDSADNIKYCKGYGKVYAGKLLGDAKTPFSATRRVYTLFKQVYEGEARKKYNECKSLLTLKTDCDDRIRIYGVQQR
jgi:5'-3' exonuclease